MEEIQTRREELVVFRYKREADHDEALDTLTFSKSKRTVKFTNSVDRLSMKMRRMSMDQSVYCLKKIDLDKQPDLANLIFRSRDLQLWRQAKIRNDLISGLRSHNFPETIRVCEIEDDWVPYRPAVKKNAMQVQHQHNYYVLAWDVIDEDKSYQEVQRPREVVDYIGESEGQMESDEIDSEGSNRQNNPNSDHPEDYDFNEEEEHQIYGECDPYNDSDELYY